MTARLESKSSKQQIKKGIKASSCAANDSEKCLAEHLKNLSESVKNDKQQITVPNENNVSILAMAEPIDDKTADRKPPKFDWIDISAKCKINFQNTNSNRDLSKQNQLPKNEIMTETLAHLY